MSILSIVADAWLVLWVLLLLAKLLVKTAPLTVVLRRLAVVLLRRCDSMASPWWYTHDYLKPVIGRGKTMVGPHSSITPLGPP